MNADRELLEMAAKAAGYTLLGTLFKLGPDGFGTKEFECLHLREVGKWNPLTDDGDAMRLATALCMSIHTGPIVATATTIAGTLRGDFTKEDAIYQDSGTAVRRVIVRCAALDGKAMP